MISLAKLKGSHMKQIYSVIAIEALKSRPFQKKVHIEPYPRCDGDPVTLSTGPFRLHVTTLIRKDVKNQIQLLTGAPPLLNNSQLKHMLQKIQQLTITLKEAARTKEISTV